MGFIRRSLFVDLKGNGEYSTATIESSKNNEWGIPDSKTLEPLFSTPLEQLENGGRITLVGSGPGDPDLLTLKAYKLLQDPNALIICDRLVSQEIVDLVQGEVKVARKLPGCAELAQEEIYWWAYQGLVQGKHVVRLKIGDPFVFGRGGEEVITFRRFGVESKVIPVSTNIRQKQIVFVAKRQHSLIPYCNFLYIGCLGCLFGSTAGKHPRHSPRSLQPGGNVHWLWSGGNVTRFDPIPQRADNRIFDGRGSAKGVVRATGTTGGISDRHGRSHH
jgi:hypothetical protein